MSGKIYINSEGIPPIPKGEWAWVIRKKGDDPDHLAYGCPCDTNCIEGRAVHNCYIPVSRAKEPNGWKWDGDWKAPTLTPSIQRMDDCRWHGFMTAGKFVKA